MKKKAAKKRAQPLDEAEANKSIEALIREFSSCEPGVSAVEDLLRSRR